MESTEKNNTDFTIQELLESHIPFVSIDDIFESEWNELDFELEKYDREDKDYDIENNQLLSFIVEQVRLNNDNIRKVPSYIRDSHRFMKLVEMSTK